MVSIDNQQRTHQPTPHAQYRRPPWLPWLYPPCGGIDRGLYDTPVLLAYRDAPGLAGLYAGAVDRGALAAAAGVAEWE